MNDIIQALRHSVNVIKRARQGKVIRCTNCNLSFLGDDAAKNYFAHAHEYRHLDVPA